MSAATAQAGGVTLATPPSPLDAPGYVGLIGASRDADGPDSDTTEAFAKLWYDSKHQTWSNIRWLGTPIAKLPLDLWVYAEIIHELRPDLIIETGTFAGGSALFMATVCDAVGSGEIVSIDIWQHDGRPVHPRITYLTASSTDPATVEAMRAKAATAETVLVVLDSDHSRDHVLAECRAYGPLVTPGSYLIVEDTNVNGHPVFPEHGPGPMEAVDAFLAETNHFVSDRRREKLMATHNPRGYLLKTR